MTSEGESGRRRCSINDAESSDSGLRLTQYPIPPERKKDIDRDTRGGCCLTNHDLIEHSILPRLPAKSLLRLQSVSRRWHRIITDPYFIHLHSQTAPSFPMCEKTWQFLEDAVQRSAGIPSMSSDKKEVWETVVASCSGLLCVMNTSFRSISLYIGNPFLRDWRLLAYPPNIVPIHRPEKIYSKRFGLAVDVGESDVSYKLVIVASEDYNGSVKHVFHVLSSRTGRWEMNKWSIIASHRSRLRGEAACVRAGVLYWLCADHDTVHTTEDHVLWFDSKDERSGFHPLPPGSSRCGCGAIGEWNGALSYVRIVGVEKIEIWSMDHQSRWTKKHSASLEKILHGDLCAVLQPSWKVMALPFQGGSAFLFNVKGAIYRYNMVTGEAQKQVGSFLNCFSFSYKSSLVPLPNLRRICVYDFG